MNVPLRRAVVRGRHTVFCGNHVGDRYDNAQAESVIGLFKTPVIDPRGPWKFIDPVEYAILEWLDRFNHRRLLEPIGQVPPAEFERAYYDRLEESAIVV